MRELRRGDLVWAELDPVRGREQAGRRPTLVVASDMFLDQADTLAIIVPVTSADRQWPNHVRLRGSELGLKEPSFALTEQIRTVTRERFVGRIGRVDRDTMGEIDTWLRDFLALPATVA